MDTFNFNNQTGEATVQLDSSFGRFTGKAYCHEDDRDMMSEKTGLEIAKWRASNKMTKAHIHELKIELRALEHLYHCMKQSTRFNEKSYEARMLKRQIKHKQEDINFLKDALKISEDALPNYIKQKDKFYNAIRKNRKQDKSR